jgi:hypothetical protein
MATKNRRVAAYLPPEVDEAFIAFKIQRGLASAESPNQNDSQALIQLLSEFLAVSPQSGYSVSHAEGLVTIEQMESLKAGLEARISELFGKLSQVNSRFDALAPADMDSGVQEPQQVEAPGQMSILDVPQDLSSPYTLQKLADRLDRSTSTVCKHRDKGNEELMKWSQKCDPDGVPWEFIDGKYHAILRDW